MDDAELVRAARIGDTSAFPAIFDRHAGRVHDLALAMLRDRNLALQVVESTFLDASVRLHALQEVHRLPVWLLAVTRRNAALRAGPTAGPDRQPALPNDDPERFHLASLVWEAVAELPLRDRTLIDLELRQGLADLDLADALGVTPEQAQDLRSRMGDRIEKGLAGYLISRTANGRCPGLAKVLKRWDGRFTSRDAGRMADHLDVCTVCTQARFDLPSPFVLYAAALPPPFPDVVRDRVVDRVVVPAAPVAAPVPGGSAFAPQPAPQPAPPPAPPPVWGPEPGATFGPGPSPQPAPWAPPAPIPGPPPVLDVPTEATAAVPASEPDQPTSPDLPPEPPPVDQTPDDDPPAPPEPDPTQAPPEPGDRPPPAPRGEP